MIYQGIGILFLCISFFSCSQESRSQRFGQEPTGIISDSLADSILMASIEAHGGDNYEQGVFSFTFRNKQYAFQHLDSSYTYELMFKKNGTLTKDILNNGSFGRTENERPVRLSSKEHNAYKNSLNSVIYFSTLPYKLKDEAVRARYQGIVNINGTPLHEIEVSFAQTNGGDDFEDVFYYWINRDNNQLMYLAYLYHVNGGGIRFRKAINYRTVNGVTFADYINFKPKGRPSLKELPELFENNELIEVSRVLLENIQWKPDFDTQ